MRDTPSAPAYDTSTMHRPELLVVADAVSREKQMDREDVIVALEEGIQKAARAKYGLEQDIRAYVDRKTGDISLSRWIEVVDGNPSAGQEMADGRDFNPVRMIPARLARKDSPGAEIGSFVVEPLPPMEFGRVGALAARQAIVNNVRDVERRNELALWKDRVGEIVNGSVLRLEYGNVIVSLGGRTEAIVPRRELIPREPFKVGDRIRAYVYDVASKERGQQVFLSRTHNGFIAKLFAQEVPEIYDGIIEIRAVARDPGSRAKMAVVSRDSSIDPVGACIGRLGSRVRAVTEELQGERVDILKWTPNPATMVIDAIAPAEVSKVVIDEEAGKMLVVVPDDQLSIAIGRRGQNVRLAAELTGWKLDLTTIAEDSNKRNEEISSKKVVFETALDVDDLLARLLVECGFESIEDILTAQGNELEEALGDAEMAAEIVTRAIAWVEANAAALEKRRVELGVDDALVGTGLPLEVLVLLGEKGIRDLDGLAEMDSEELMEAAPGMLDEATAGAAIMAARESWFAGEDKAAADA